ncbi:MAG: hypothetical protein L0Y66_24240 [Myxococcaceae bacterium]|nr:hypothetical protein [Myxococcaceae bacterium]MCI0672594.1 hypothetical protein [Myxococcaceae bacterium]
MTMRTRTLVSLLAVAVLGCAARNPAAPPAGAPSTTSPSPLDQAAERYVKLVLALGQHDSAYVDAYYGPEAWAEEAKASPAPLADIGTRAAALTQELEALPVPADDMLALRRRTLVRQLGALSTRVRMLSGEKLSFDDESVALYDARSPHKSEAEFQAVLAELERVVPGKGPLAARVDAFRKNFVIPKEKLDVVFRAAIDEARRRTLEHISLPEGETFTLEYVTNKPWSGYNWYKGNAKSLIQINTDLPIYVWRAIDLAAHEGYPGHHVYNALLEKHLVRERGWVEFSIYPLFSPQSLIAEGSANYGIAVAFPDAEAFARDVLFPLAGLDPKLAADYVRVEKLTAKLDYAGNEAARRYLDGAFTRDQARDWLVRYALMSPERATQRVTFFDAYRSYVINYNLGRDLVKGFVERQGGTEEQPARRWELFHDLLSSPRLPSDLR